MEKWVEQYSDFLYRYAYSRVNDTTTAEDLVQETFLSALKAYENFDGKSSERTWFVSILKHKIIDCLRFRKHLLILREFSRSQRLWEVSVDPSLELSTQARERIKSTLSA